MKIKNAIIIHGPGRSGTTLISNILSLHQDMFWISGYLNKYPDYPIVSIFNNLHRIKIFERFTRNKKKIPRPAEAYNFWLHYLKNFNNKKEPIDIKEVENVTKTISKIDQYSFGTRFITKLTGASRFNYIDAIFEDPDIIWIDRKPQSVVMSYYKQKWNYKNKPDKFKQKLKKDLIVEYTKMYGDFFMEKEKLKKFKFHQVFYEDMVSNPKDFFSQLCRDVNVDFNSNFMKILDSWNINRNTNNSYKTVINDQEEDLLDSNVAKYSQILGYD